MCRHGFCENHFGATLNSMNECLFTVVIEDVFAQLQHLLGHGVCFVDEFDDALGRQADQPIDDSR